MARLVLVLALVLGCSVAAGAQEFALESGAGLRVNERAIVDVLPPSSVVAWPAPSAPWIRGLPSFFVLTPPDVARLADVEPARRAVDRKFFALGAGLLAATAADIHSTYASMRWCPSCRETNPYAAPFIERGPASAYTAGILFDVAVMGASAAMRKSRNPALRAIWWVPPAVLIAGHVLAIRHNYGLRQICQDNPRCGR